MSRAVIMSLIVLVLVAMLTTYLIVSQQGPFGWTPRQAETSTTQQNTLQGPTTIVDVLNRTLVFSGPLERVAIVGKGSRYLIEVAYMFVTAPDKVVALDSGSVENPVLKLRDPNLKSKASFSNFPNVEELLKLKPDLIVLKSSFTSQGRAYEEAGLKVVYVDVETPEQFYGAVLIFGKIFGEESRAGELINYFKNMVRAVEERLEGPVDKPATLFIYYDAVRDRVVKAPPAGYLQSVLVEMAGGKSVNRELLGSSAQPVSLEQIIAWSPEILFIATYSNDPSPADYVRLILSSEEWRNVPAVREGRVYPVPGGAYSWDMPGPKWVLCLTYMTKAIHSEGFTDVSVKDLTIDFYMRTYGLDRASAEEITSYDLRGIEWLS